VCALVGTVGGLGPADTRRYDAGCRPQDRGTCECFQALAFRAATSEWPVRRWERAERQTASDGATYPRRVSSHLVSKTDIDALVTIALQWTEDGHVDAMPEPARTVLRVTLENASDVGRQLWQTNADAFYFGGPPEGCDPDVREEAQKELERDGGTPYVDAYLFEALPGVATPWAAARVIRYYAYQTQGDAWDPDDAFYRGGVVEPPFAAYFTTAMRWYSLALRGALPLDRVPEPLSSELSNAEDRLRDERGDFPWGLKESDRNVFT